jgi:MFS family permease
MQNSHDPYFALRFRDFRLLLTGAFFASLGTQMITVAIGWELYERTGSALALGLVGLVQVIPVFILSLPAGQFIDRFNRKRIVIWSQVVLVFCSLGLTALSFTHGSLALVYVCLLIYGCAVAFDSPATAVLVAQVVPEHAFENAATWESSTGQLASVLGPALGGLLIALLKSAALVYALNAGAALIFIILLFFLRIEQQKTYSIEATTFGAMMEGLRFLKSSQIILAAITLDMFAVFLGGATTLLPIFAKDILHVGPTGLGWLRAAPSIGALGMSFVTAHTPPLKKAGRTLLLVVACFGVATIVFGISRVFWLSLVMLLVLGAMDNISVVIRSTLLLTRTPDALRGRINAINFIFVGASNELGGFESGLAAQLFGPVIAVAAGGAGTVLVVLCVALIWPEMRRLGALSENKPDPQL